MDKGSMHKWNSAKRTLLILLGAFGSVATAFSWWRWSAPHALTSFFAILCLALGFWITEMLIGVFTRVKRANATAIGLLFIAKFAWWGMLFYGARHLPAGHDGAVAVGLGTFLLALLFGTLRHYGMPSISDAESPRDP
jgi:hypothetical protein